MIVINIRVRIRIQRSQAQQRIKDGMLLVIVKNLSMRISNTYHSLGSNTLTHLHSAGGPSRPLLSCQNTAPLNWQ
jgi:hypothetical protein